MGTKNRRPTERHAETKPPRGICRVCGCVDEDGCPEGCDWADKAHTCCTACVNLTREQMAAKRELSLDELEIDFGFLLSQLHELSEALERTRHRCQVLRSEQADCK